MFKKKMLLFENPYKIVLLVVMKPQSKFVIDPFLGYYHFMGLVVSKNRMVKSGKVKLYGWM